MKCILFASFVTMQMFMIVFLFVVFMGHSVFVGHVVCWCAIVLSNVYEYFM